MRGVQVGVILLFIVSLFFLFSDSTHEGFQSSDLKKEACAQLLSAKTDLEAKIQTMRSQVQDMSGVGWSEFNWRTENLQFQRNNLEMCTKTLTNDCKQLAGMDSIIYKTLPALDATNNSIFASEYDIQQQLSAVNDTNALIGCTLPLTGSGSTYSFNVLTDAGYIDTPRLRRKMIELSPYYISPDALQYISRLLTDTPQSVANFQSASANSASIANTIQTISFITKQFFP
jgi:hypothetical protein